jgi:hypothetical protein
MPTVPPVLRSTILALAWTATAFAAGSPARRPLTTDRPDATDSPYTIEPGHVQLEMDFASWTKASVAGARLTETDLVPFNLRFGIESDLELAIMAQPYRRDNASFPAGPGAKQYGFGDMIARVKLNLLGNDSGDFGLGAIADLKLPTGSGGIGNGKFEGGMAVPFASKLAGGWTGGAMTAFDFVYDGGGYQLAWRNSATFSHEIGPETSGFLELASETGVGTHVATFDTGISHQVGKNTEFDVGVNLGLSRAAPDVRLFAGMAHRF